MPSLLASLADKIKPNLQQLNPTFGKSIPLVPNEMAILPRLST
jgi:hypothetical protein